MASFLGWLRGLVDQVAAWDERLAKAELERFEASHGLDLRAARVSLADLDQVLMALQPEGRPLIEHHWATWCEPCLSELPRLETLAGRLRNQADVVGVSWERFEGAEADAEATRARVAAFVDGHGLTWPTVVYDGTPDALFERLRLPERTVPQTRVLDADGGVLRVFPGPLSVRDVDGIVDLLRS